MIKEIRKYENNSYRYFKFINHKNEILCIYINNSVNIATGLIFDGTLSPLGMGLATPDIILGKEKLEKKIELYEVEFSNLKKEFKFNLKEAKIIFDHCIEHYRAYREEIEKYEILFKEIYGYFN